MWRVTTHFNWKSSTNALHLPRTLLERTNFISYTQWLHRQSRVCWVHLLLNILALKKSQFNWIECGQRATVFKNGLVKGHITAKFGPNHKEKGNWNNSANKKIFKINWIYSKSNKIEYLANCLVEFSRFFCCCCSFHIGDNVRAL